MQSLGAPVDRAVATARVALNLRGVAVEELTRGDALLTPGAFRVTDLVDVALAGDPHGAAARRAGRPRRLGDRRRAAAAPRRRVLRLRLAAPLPLRVGDRLLLRDPGARRVLGADVLDVDPPGAAPSGRGPAAGGGPRGSPAARRRAPISSAGAWCGPTTSSPWAGPCPRTPTASARGCSPPDWSRSSPDGVPAVVARPPGAHPLEPGPPVEVVRRALDLPDAELLPAVVRPPLALRDGRVVEAAAALPDPVQRAVDGSARGSRTTRSRRRRPRPRRRGARPAGAGGRRPQWSAGPDRRGHLAGAGHRGRGAGRLAALPQPFTLSQARQAWGTSRRVAVPLMEWLDARGVTARLPDNTRRLR